MRAFFLETAQFADWRWRCVLPNNRWIFLHCCFAYSVFLCWDLSFYAIITYNGGTFLFTYISRVRRTSKIVAVNDTTRRESTGTVVFRYIWRWVFPSVTRPINRNGRCAHITMCMRQVVLERVADCSIYVSLSSCRTATINVFFFFLLIRINQCSWCSLWSKITNLVWEAW